MDPKLQQPIIRKIRQEHQGRYAEAAYYFVLEAVDYTMFLLGKNRLQGESRHVTVAELLKGIRKMAIEEFGPLAAFTFKSWGVSGTADFGHIVFELCEAGLLNRREQDRFQDFQDGFDFEATFEEVESAGS